MSDINGLPRRRHDPPDHQQPDRLHDRARVRPLVAVLHRRRQDRPGADLPCQRRRPRGLRARGAAGVRVPPDVPQGRRHRHGLLPPPRPQRGRRPELHAAADVQGDRRAAQRPQAVRRVARQARRHHGRGGRAGARRLPGASSRWRSTRPGPTRPAGTRRPSRRSRSGVLPHVADRVSTARTPRQDLRPPDGLPGGLHAAPEARPPVRDAGEAVPRAARSTGRPPRPSPSVRSCSKATASASPARTAAAARSASATRR